MLEAWPGRRDVELVAEPTASITAENMARTLPLLTARGITTSRSCAACCTYRACGTSSAASTRGTASAAATSWCTRGGERARVAWEAAALPLARRQRRAARAEIERRL